MAEEFLKMQKIVGSFFYGVTSIEVEALDIDVYLGMKIFVLTCRGNESRVWKACALYGSYMY